MTSIETVTTAGAGAAVTAPWWHNVADMPHVLQLLGATWLVVQIVAKVYSTWIKRNT
jgi:hypothetical protein